MSATADSYTYVAWVDHGPQSPGTTAQLMSLVDVGRDMWPLYDPEAERKRRIEREQPKPWHKMNRHEKRAHKAKVRALNKRGLQ